MIEPVHYRRQRIGLRAIVSFSTLAPMPYQVCPLQHGEVLGDSGLRHARIVGQCVDGLFAMPGQLFENGPARRVGKSAEHVIGIGRLHAETITVRLLDVKGKVTQGKVTQFGFAGMPVSTASVGAIPFSENATVGLTPRASHGAPGRAARMLAACGGEDARVYSLPGETSHVPPSAKPDSALAKSPGHSCATPQNWVNSWVGPKGRRAVPVIRSSTVFRLRAAPSSLCCLSSHSRTVSLV